MKRICVYCASSSRIGKVYFEATERLAELLVNENTEVVFGGGAAGLMGRLADTISKMAVESRELCRNS